MLTPTRLLHLLPPETAHGLALRLVRAVPWPEIAPTPRLAIDLTGLKLAHPIGLAAGFDKDAVVCESLLRLGFSFVEAGTVTPRPQAGNPRPRLFRLGEDRAIINRMGFNNAGLETFARRLEARDRRRGIVGANLGANKDSRDRIADYVIGVRRLAPLADYLTLNISSPNTPGLRALQQADALDELLAAVIPARDEIAASTGSRTPLFLKVAPDLTNDEVATIADVALARAVDALIVANTSLARPPELRSRHVNETGGLSGAPLFELSTALLRRFARRLNGRLPLIGVGGIATAEQAYAKLRAGASAVQIYTGMIYEGPLVVRRIVQGLDQLLQRDGFGAIAEVIGRDL